MKKLTYILLLFCAVANAQWPLTKTGNFIDIPAGTYNDVLDSIDYVGNIVYIDPSGDDGYGTYEDPTNIYPTTFQANTAYLQLKGTTYSSDVFVNAAGVLIGQYGTSATNAKVDKIRFEEDDCTVRNVEFDGSGAYLDLGSSTLPIENMTVYRITHNGTSAGSAITSGARSFRIIGCFMQDAYTDAIFSRNRGVALGSWCEIAYNNIIAPNQAWFDNQDPGASPGDNIQLQKYNNVHIHHDILDHSETGNKFTMINGDVDTKETSLQLNLIFEFNYCVAPLGGSGGNINLADGTNNLIRYNVFTSPNNNSYAINLENTNANVGQDNEIYGNLVYYHSADIKRYTGAGTKTAKIYNNTLHTTASFASEWVSSSFYNENNYVPIATVGLSSSNVSIDTAGASNLFNDYLNGDYSLKTTSTGVSSAVWDGANMDAGFNIDIEGNIFQQITDNFSVGYLQNQSAIAEQTDSIQVDFGDVNTFGWKRLYPNNTSVTNGSITVSYDGTGGYFDGYPNGVYPDVVAEENMGSSSQDSMYCVIKADSSWVAVEFYFSVNAGQERLVDIYANGVLIFNDHNLNTAQILKDTLQIGDSLIITQKPTGDDPDVAMNAIRVFQIGEQPIPPTPPTESEQVTSFNGRLLASEGTIIIPSFNPDFTPCQVLGVLDFDGINDYVIYDAIADVTGVKTIKFNCYIESDISSPASFMVVNGLSDDIFVARMSSTNTFRVMTSNSGVASSSADFDISSYYNKIIDIEIVKGINSITSIKIDDVLVSYTLGNNGYGAFPTLFMIGNDNNSYYLNNSLLWNCEIVGTFLAPGHPNGNQTSAWTNNGFNATINGSPTTTNICE